MKERDIVKDSSGQVIVITALLVAMVLLSTSIYVIETEKNVPLVGVDTSNGYLAFRLATRNTLISALANMTNGGNPDVLTADLNQLGSVFASNSYQSITQTSFTTLNQTPYQNGVEVSWGSNGQGVSSDCVVLTVNSTGRSSSSNLEYRVTVVTSVNVGGSYRQLDGNATSVTLRLNLQNEGQPALAQAMTFYFQDSSDNWVRADSPTTVDFGNGTYTGAFTVENALINLPLRVSAVCLDQRGITAVANSTCTNAS